jgi:Arc/MetJ family transcription regulator
MHIKNMLIKCAKYRHKMKTTLFIDESLLKKAKKASGVKTKREAVGIALEEYVRRKKAEKLIDLEGKIELSFTLSEFLKRRKSDFLYR